jgi:hypothetical protein
VVCLIARLLWGTKVYVCARVCACARVCVRACAVVLCPPEVMDRSTRRGMVPSNRQHHISVDTQTVVMRSERECGGGTVRGRVFAGATFSMFTADVKSDFVGEWRLD